MLTPQEVFQGDQAIVAHWFPVFDILSDEAHLQLPTHFKVMEYLYWVMGFLTLLHAARSLRVGKWLGLIMFGLTMEASGVLITRSHFHPDFTIMLFNFLPLKEAIWCK